MCDILRAIRDGLADGGRVYVHCWGGHGRTATVAGCWYRELGLSGQEALCKIAAARAYDSSLGARHSPETSQQCDFVRNWEPFMEIDTNASENANSDSLPPGPSMLDRFRGCLLGLATGDALGTTLEFRSPGTFEPIDDIVGGGPFGLGAGQWTDDTSMALCLAESLIDKGAFDPVDQIGRYVRWWREGYLSSTGECFDIGNTTREALRTFVTSGEPFSGPAHSHSAGNGSIMRLAPVPMFFARMPTEAIRLSGESSRTTHQHPAAIDACRYLGGLIAAALSGTAKTVLLGPRFCAGGNHWAERPLVREIDEVAAGSFKTRVPPKIEGTGHVVRSLEAALWAFQRTDSFREGALLAVNLGDDADTTGAVFGQLAGAYYGCSGIPQHWKVKIAKRELIEKMADMLYEVAYANP